jgi:uncharacterized protein (DUF2147 family)
MLIRPHGTGRAARKAPDLTSRLPESGAGRTDSGALREEDPMTRILMLAALAAFAAGAAAAEPLVGTWRTAKDDNGNSGLIEIKPCGDALCGTLVRAFDAGGNRVESPNVGRRLIWDTKPAGGGEYRGMVYSPDRDAEYRSKLVLTGDRLSVSGCRLGICREGGVWTRSN